MPIGNQLVRERVGTFNFSRKVYFILKENNFYTVDCLSKIIAYLSLDVILPFIYMFSNIYF